ncbi:hypothetical protein CBL_08487 [Carabus blaptoides fortunei]
MWNTGEQCFNIKSSKDVNVSETQNVEASAVVDVGKKSNTKGKGAEKNQQARFRDKKYKAFAAELIVELIISIVPKSDPSSLPDIKLQSAVIPARVPVSLRGIPELLNQLWARMVALVYNYSTMVEFGEHMFKPELYSLAKGARMGSDNINHAQGHNVSRFPPYYCQDNAIEEIWSQCKRYYDNHIRRDGFGDTQVTSMWKESLSHVSDLHWRNYASQTDAVIEEA